jgi:hypothetical protein
MDRLNRLAPHRPVHLRAKSYANVNDAKCPYRLGFRATNYDEFSFFFGITLDDRIEALITWNIWSFKVFSIS